VNFFNRVGIPVVQLIGNINRVRKAMEKFEQQKGTNHTEGTNMPMLSHVIIMGSRNVAQSRIRQIIGRGTRHGRVGKVKVIHLDIK
jgi:hypothetical protein